MSSHFAELQSRLATLADLLGIWRVLFWDQNTMMPPGGAEMRGQQIATLQKISHEILTNARTGELLDALEPETFPAESDEAAILRVAKRQHENASKVPAEFVERFARLKTKAQSTWTKARQEKDFSQFAPVLEEVFEYTRRHADYLGYDEHPYDALHDLYEEGSRVSAVRPVFAELREATRKLLKDIGGGREIGDAPIHGHFPKDLQEKLGREIVEAFGYSFEHGRLDAAVHPFSIGGKYDVRITTRYNESVLSYALFATMHEAGHALYTQNLDENYVRSPFAAVNSSGIHESQAQIWEKPIGRSYGFWQHAYPRVQETFPESLGDASLDDFYQAINKVAPTFIRVEADELTYNLHIMVRFELELDLLEGKLAVKDVPEAWNAKYQEYLGITPPDDALGCLQDVHWSAGMVGYFPTYTLGNIMSVQLFEAAKSAHPELASEIAEGKFSTLLGWLRENVHRHGAKYPPRELLTRATGGELDAKPYIDYLNGKFRDLYGLT